MINEKTIKVDNDGAGLRLDKFLQQVVPGTSRSLVLDAIAQDQVRVNGRRGAKGGKLNAGDEVFVIRLLEQSDIRVRPDPGMPLSVLHEDDVLLVLDKPAGIPVHPLGADETGTLANAMIARYPELQDVGGDPLFPALAHRIDTDTSGVVVAAKTNPAYAFLREEFRARRVGKEYIALVHGRVEKAGRLEHVLEHDPAERGRMRVVREDRHPSGERPLGAITEYTVARSYDRHTLLHVTILTGVTHQIRCQLAAAGHPVAGDRVYGAGGSDELDLHRHFLHAAAIEIMHPATAVRARFSSPLPAELREALARLGSGGEPRADADPA